MAVYQLTHTHNEILHLCYTATWVNNTLHVTWLCKLSKQQLHYHGHISLLLSINACHIANSLETSGANEDLLFTTLPKEEVVTHSWCSMTHSLDSSLTWSVVTSLISSVSLGDLCNLSRHSLHNQNNSSWSMSGSAGKLP